MIPLYDNIPSRTVPVVNYTVIALCSLAFLVQMSSTGFQESRAIIEGLGMIPARVFNPDLLIEYPNGSALDWSSGALAESRNRAASESLVPAFLTPLTCIFLHGGWLHFVGNMWFLWIFGDNVEDCLGHRRYLLFYLAAGLTASIAHLLTNTDSTLPTIGASGAIAGVMGAYMVLYPRARVLTVIPLFIFIQVLALPAVLVLGIWFALQFYEVLATSADGSGVAWWAHIGGFTMGLVTILVLRTRKGLKINVQQARRPVQNRFTGLRRR
jgi:membrane associated rhomboid family serine protease